MTDERIKEKYEGILNKNGLMADLCSFDDTAPLVSIIILNRNGFNHLKRLFKDFKENIPYPF